VALDSAPTTGMPGGRGGRTRAARLRGRIPRRRARRSRLLADDQREGLYEVEVRPQQGELRLIGRTEAAEPLVIRPRHVGLQALAPRSPEDRLEQIPLIGGGERRRPLNANRAHGAVPHIRPVHPTEEITRAVEITLLEAVAVFVVSAYRLTRQALES